MAKDDDEEFAQEKDTFLDEAEEHEESDEELEVSFETGVKEADPYSKEGRERLEEDDEAKPGELGYAKGSGGGSGHAGKRAPAPSLSKKKPSMRMAIKKRKK